MSMTEVRGDASSSANAHVSWKVFPMVPDHHPSGTIYQAERQRELAPSLRQKLKTKGRERRAQK